MLLNPLPPMLPPLDKQVMATADEVGTPYLSIYLFAWNPIWSTALSKSDAQVLHSFCVCAFATISGGCMLSI